jgi:hypothetical protein
LSVPLARASSTGRAAGLIGQFQLEVARIHVPGGTLRASEAPHSVTVAGAVCTAAGRGVPFKFLPARRLCVGQVLAVPVANSSLRLGDGKGELSTASY